MANFITASGLGAAVAGGMAVKGTAPRPAGSSPTGPDFATLIAEMAEKETDRAATEPDSLLSPPVRGGDAGRGTWVMPPQLHRADTAVPFPDNDNSAPMAPEPPSPDMLDTDMPQPEMRIDEATEGSGMDAVPGADAGPGEGDPPPAPQAPPSLLAAPAADTTLGADLSGTGAGRTDSPPDTPDISKLQMDGARELAVASPLQEPETAALPQLEDGASTGATPRTAAEGAQPFALTQPGPTPVEGVRPSSPAATATPPSPPMPTTPPEMRIAATTTDSGGSVVEVALSPAELGKVRMIIGADAAQLGVTVLAERPETLELLRRNIDLLAAELASLGYDTTDLGFTFGREDAEGRGSAAAEGDSPFPEQALPAADMRSPSGPISSLNRLNLRL